MADDYLLDKILEMNEKKIGIEKFDETKILIETDDKLPVETTFKIL